MKSHDDKPVGDQAQAKVAPGKKQWQDPKLAFVEPKLRKRGDVKDVTGLGFFGAFSP